MATKEVSFKKRLSNQMYLKFADEVIAEIERLKNMGKPINTTKISELLAVIQNGCLKLDNNDLYYDNPSNARLNEMFERLIDAAPSFNEKQIHVLTKIAHFFEHYSLQKTKGFEYAEEDFINPFDFKQLRDLLKSDKVPDDMKDFLLKNIYSDFFTKRFKNSLTFNDTNFGDTQSKIWMLEQLFNLLEAKKVGIQDIYLKSGDVVELDDWISCNFSALTDFSIEHKLDFVNSYIFLNTLEYTEEDMRSRMAHSHYGVNKENYVNIEQIRELMVGSVERFNQLKSTAEALGCLQDKSYWSGAITKNASSLPLDGLNL